MRGRSGNARSVRVEVSGFRNSSPAECVSFLERKTRIRITNYSPGPNFSLSGHVRLDKEAAELAAWLGVAYRDSTLKITKAAANDDTVRDLRVFFELRYNPQQKLLDLSRVQHDPMLVQKDFFKNASVLAKFFPALLAVIGGLGAAVSSVNLSENNLTDLLTVLTLAQHFPKLQNLLLQDNRIARAKVFDVWRNKLCHVRELIVTGNPVTNEPDAKARIVKVFPRLVILNGEVVRNEQVLLANLSFPFPPQAMFLEAEVAELATSFITNYIGLWDSNRAGLMGLYQAELQFSLLADTLPPHMVDLGNFTYYMQQLRNWMRVLLFKGKMDRVGQGPEQIFKCFQQIPKSKHSLAEKPENYSMESFRVAAMNAISITLHGEFEEVGAPEVAGLHRQKGRNKPPPPKLQTKSFDRTFVVVQSPAGFVIASDLFSVRTAVDLDAWKPHTTPPPATPSNTPAPTLDLPAEVKANFSPAQQELLLKVLLETKLNINYAVMLCEGSSWIYEQCVVNFKNLQGTLPPDAFQ